MVLKSWSACLTGTLLLVASAAGAAEYRPDDFLKLDLSKAVLSPTPLGPEAHFQPVPVQAKSDQASAAPQADAKPKPEAKAGSKAGFKAEVPRTVAARRTHVAKPREASAEPVPATPHGAARSKLAHRRSNPLDAQAMDTRVQTWPCKPGGGGICSWK